MARKSNPKVAKRQKLGLHPMQPSKMSAKLNHRTTKPRLTVIGQAAAENASPYSVEKGVPLPPMGGNYRIYPFGLMEVGDSFALRDSSRAGLLRVRAAASTYAKLNGKKFAVRALDPVSKKYRCWRKA